MGRHGYVDDIDDNLQFGRHRGRVASAIRGGRGQQFLRDTLTALEAMPVKMLVAEDLRSEDGLVCTLGACMVAKGLEPDNFDPYDHEGIGAVLNISPVLVQEIEWLNDEDAPDDPEKRWEWMHKKIQALIKA